MKLLNLMVISAFMLLLVPHSLAQNLEFSGGWAHSTGDGGVDGFDAGIAAMFTSRVGIGLNFDEMWDTSKIGSFELTSIGQTTAKNHLQNFLVGPRAFFAQRKIKKYMLSPFGEAQFGLSHLHTSIQQQQTGLNESSSDTAFTWMIGAGADYVIAGHWAARANLDLLRTHFVDVGQSRLRFVLGIAYTFRRR
jgi:opacity protein-like surface antigen